MVLFNILEMKYIIMDLRGTLKKMYTHKITTHLTRIECFCMPEDTKSSKLSKGSSSLSVTP